MSTLGVQSIPELYGTLLGWQQYDASWHLLVQTGLVFLPFISMLVTHGITLYAAQGAKAAQASLRHISMTLTGHLLVIALAGMPCLTLHPHQTQTDHTCQRTTTTQHTAGHTSTTLDAVWAAQPTAEVAQVPLWWYGVMRIAEGITASLHHAIGCVPNLRALITSVNLTATGVSQF